MQFKIFRDNFHFASNCSADNRILSNRSFFSGQISLTMANAGFLKLGSADPRGSVMTAQGVRNDMTNFVKHSGKQPGHASLALHDQ